MKWFERWSGELLRAAMHNLGWCTSVEARAGLTTTIDELSERLQRSCILSPIASERAEIPLRLTRLMTGTISRTLQALLSTQRDVRKRQLFAFLDPTSWSLHDMQMPIPMAPFP